MTRPRPVASLRDGKPYVDGHALLRQGSRRHGSDSQIDWVPAHPDRVDLFVQSPNGWTGLTVSNAGACFRTWALEMVPAYSPFSAEKLSIGSDVVAAAVNNYNSAVALVYPTHLRIFDMHRSAGSFEPSTEVRIEGITKVEFDPEQTQRTLLIHVPGGVFRMEHVRNESKKQMREWMIIAG